MEKKIIIGIIVLFIVLISISFVNAEFWLCLNKGDRIDYCGGYKPAWTCPDGIGCEKCMSIYREAENCYVHGSWPKCNTIQKECSTFKGNTTIDGEPPELTLNNPLQDGLYTSRSILLDFNLDEKADVYYYDNINGRGRWKKVCSGCYSYSRKRSFKEGLNNLTFKAKDVVGNTAYVNLGFFIDSKKPKIRRTEPRKGFASGLFEVQFSEENPKSLILNYGNSLTGYRNVELDIENDCYEDRKRYYCDVEVDLTDYNNQYTEYWFELEDIAGSTDESKKINLGVDTIAPIINDNPIYEIDGKYVYFNIGITEPNFDEVAYYDYSESMPRWRKLCSRLRDGRCEKKKSFRRGHHVVDIQVTDKSGNAIAERIEFDIDY